MAGIYWNEEGGIISLSSDGTTWITLTDKNLGATEVYNDGDDLTVNNAGNYYQWGNNHGFTFNETPSNTSDQRVNVLDYGPGNYWNDSTFRTYNSGSWDNPLNNNLWGDTTNTNEARQGPCSSGFHVPSDSDLQSLITLLTNFGLLPSNEDTAFDINKANTICEVLKSGRTARIQYNLNKGYEDGVLFLSTHRNNSGKIYCFYMIRAGANGYFYHNKISSYSILNWSGYAIRPFANTPVVPYANEGWTKLYGDDLPDRPVPPEPQLPKLKRIVKHNNYYFFGEKPTHASGITLNKNSITLTTAGQTEQLIATVTPEDAVNKKVLWSSSDTSVATVSSTGLVTCVEPGECTITATCADGGASASCSVINVIVDLLLVGGGGGGGGGHTACFSGGGGGAGGVIQCCGYVLLNVSYNVVIGNAGAGGNVNALGISGGNSCFGELVAYGGGGGGSWPSGTAVKGSDGGSGGGGPGARSGYGVSTGGKGCVGQGYNGGCGHLGYVANYLGGGGGGGAGRIGLNSDYCLYQGGDGGNGITSDMSGINQPYAGGGGGGGYMCNAGYAYCGGGKGGDNIIYNGCPATTCGSGGGGGMHSYCGGAGAGGIFILRYPSNCGYNIVGGTKYECNGYCIHCFTSNGTLTVN